MEQIKQYLRVLMFIATADNEIKKEEMDCFEEIAVANGLPENSAEHIRQEIASGMVDINETLSAIDDDKTKEQLIRDLLTMCYADDNYSLSEKNGMHDICNAIGFDAKKLGQLERESKRLNAAQKVSDTVKNAFAIGMADTVAFGKKTINGGKHVFHSISNGLNSVGAKITFSMESAKKVKEENKELREQLKKTTLTETIKQKIIVQLGKKIANLTEQLQEEKRRNQKNAQMIQELQEQLDDLMATMEVAQSARTA